MKKFGLVGMILVLLLASLSLTAEGQGEKPYPSKDIQFITSGGAGGGTDTICRKLASIIEKNNDITMPVINKPGKGEAEAPYEVMTARPDGYTIGNVTYGGAIGAIYYKLIPNYTVDNLKFVAVVTQEADALMVKADAPWQSFDEFIAEAKANPGELSIAITAIGGRPSMITTQMEEIYGVEFSQIEYVEGAGPQREALLSGEVDAAITSLGDFSAVLKSGAVRGLVEYSTAQNATYTSVPPITEFGHPELEMGSFIAIVAPEETPQDVLEKIEQLYYDAQHSDDFRDWTLSVGVTPTWYGMDKAETFVRNVMKSNFATLDKMRAQGIIE